MGGTKRPKAKSPQSTTAERPTPQADPPGTGIQRRRPWRLLATLILLAGWLTFLSWTAWQNGQW